MAPAGNQLTVASAKAQVTRPTGAVISTYWQSAREPRARLWLLRPEPVFGAVGRLLYAGTLVSAYTPRRHRAESPPGLRASPRVLGWRPPPGRPPGSPRTWRSKYAKARPGTAKAPVGCRACKNRSGTRGGHDHRRLREAHRQEFSGRGLRGRPTKPAAACGRTALERLTCWSSFRYAPGCPVELEHLRTLRGGGQRLPERETDRLPSAPQAQRTYRRATAALRSVTQDTALRPSPRPDLLFDAPESSCLRPTSTAATRAVEKRHVAGASSRLSKN